MARAHAAIDAALEVGITTFDHADIYTRGKAEEVFGRVLAERPELRAEMELQTKCGIVLGTPGAPGRYDSSAAAIVARVEDSLRRLGVECIDRLLLHRPDPLASHEEIAGAFARLHAEGKVAGFGVSNMSGAQLGWLQSALDLPLEANQLSMSLKHHDWLESGVLVNHEEGAAVAFPHGTIEHCRDQGVELQAWSPLARGLYSGNAGDAPTAADAATAALVTDLASGFGCAPEAVVLGWLMRHPAGIRPVLGTTSVERIRACAEAGNIAGELSAEQWYGLWISARGRDLP